jgi:hypothetical protein
MIGLLILVLVALFGFSFAGTGSGTSGSTSPRVGTLQPKQHYDSQRWRDPCRGTIPGNRGDRRSKLPLPKGCLPPARSGGLPGRIP